MVDGAHRLIVLRHAKSAWPEVADQERPLAARGRRDAPAAGRWLRDAGLVPDLVLCSPARRTRETWDLVAPFLAAPAPVRFEPRIYGADTDDLLGLLRDVPEAVRTLLLVGHNPGVQELSLALALAGAPEPPSPADMRKKFPTSGIAVLRLPGRWADTQPGAGRLTAFVVPRGGEG
jgi:phosphohistidine phosphatase